MLTDDNKSSHLWISLNLCNQKNHRPFSSFLYDFSTELASIPFFSLSFSIRRNDPLRIFVQSKNKIVVISSSIRVQIEVQILYIYIFFSCINRTTINIFFSNAISIKVLLIENYEKRWSVNYLSRDRKTFPSLNYI